MLSVIFFYSFKPCGGATSAEWLDSPKVISFLGIFSGMMGSIRSPHITLLFSLFFVVRLFAFWVFFSVLDPGHNLAHKEVITFVALSCITHDRSQFNLN